MCYTADTQQSLAPYVRKHDPKCIRLWVYILAFLARGHSDGILGSESFQNSGDLLTHSDASCVDRHCSDVQLTTVYSNTVYSLTIYNMLLNGLNIV